MFQRRRRRNRLIHAGVDDRRGVRRAVGLELGASIAAFDATDFDRLSRFFDELPAPIDHVLVTGPGPYYAPLAELDLKRKPRLPRKTAL